MVLCCLYTIYTNQAKGYTQGLLSNTWHFDLRVVMVIMQHLWWLIKGDIILQRAGSKVVAIIHV